jgi:hypothetical protein
VLQTALPALYLVLYAHLTGQVLRTNIPAFPQRAWTRLHLGIGLVIGFLGGLAMMNHTDVETMDRSEVAAVFAFMLVLGAIAGVVFGGLQALVLRRAAQGMGIWIGLWVLAAALVFPVAGCVEMLFPGPRALKHEFITAGMTVIVGIISSVIMLPAVRRLRAKV